MFAVLGYGGTVEMFTSRMMMECKNIRENIPEETDKDLIIRQARAFSGFYKAGSLNFTTRRKPKQNPKYLFKTKNDNLLL